MTAPTYEIDFFYVDLEDREEQWLLEFAYYPGELGCHYGHPDSWYPPCEDEVEVIRIVGEDGVEISQERTNAIPGLWYEMEKSCWAHLYKLKEEL